MVIAQPENNIDTKRYLLGYMLDHSGRRTLVKVFVDDCGFIIFTPIQERNFNEEITIKP